MELSSLKEAMLNKRKVMYTESEYSVNAVIFRLKENQLLLQAELLDKSGHSVVIADATKINLKENAHEN